MNMTGNEVQFEATDIKLKKEDRFFPFCPFPVGFIYMSSVNVSPASLYGGTWFKVEDNRFWLPATNYGESNGSNYIEVGNLPSHNHTGYSDNVATSHSHTISDYILSFVEGTDSASIRLARMMKVNTGDASYISWNAKPPISRYTTSWNSATHKHSITTYNTGDGYAYWQPYRTCYCWIRTA